MSVLNPSRPRPVTRVKPFVFIIFSVLGSLLLVLLASVDPRQTTQIFYGAVALLLLGLAAAVIMAKGQGLRRSLAVGQLGPYFGLSTALVFGLASLPWSGNSRVGEAFVISPDSILQAMVVVGIGLCCFVLGYMAVTPSVVRHAGSWLQRTVISERPLKSGQRPAWLLMTIALLADAIRAAGGNFGYLSNVQQLVSSPNPIIGPVSVLSSFSLFAIVVSANDYARARGKQRLLSLSLLLIIQSALGLFSGDKETLALGFVAAILGYGASTLRFPMVSVALSAIVFVFLVVPLNTNYRNLINVETGRLSPLQALEQFWGQGLGSFLILSPNGADESPEAQTLGRLSRIGDVAIVVQRTPSEIPYRSLSELLEAPGLGLVPRVLWRDKPILATGYIFSQEYYGLPSYVFTSHAVTPQGDLWRHGGWPILIFGMVFLGVFVRILDTASSRVADFPLGLLLVLSFFALIVKQEMDVVSLAAAVPSLLVGVALATRLVTRKGEPPKPVTVR